MGDEIAVMGCGTELVGAADPLAGSCAGGGQLLELDGLDVPVPVGEGEDDGARGIRSGLSEMPGIHPSERRVERGVLRPDPAVPAVGLRRGVRGRDGTIPDGPGHALGVGFGFRDPFHHILREPLLDGLEGEADGVVGVVLQDPQTAGLGAEDVSQGVHGGATGVGVRGHEHHIRIIDWPPVLVLETPCCAICTIFAVCSAGDICEACTIERGHDPCILGEIERLGQIKGQHVRVVALGCEAIGQDRLGDPRMVAPA